MGLNVFGAIYQYVYLLNVVSRIRGLSDEELNKYDITDVQSFMKMIETEITLLASGETKSKEQKAVEAWFYKELETNAHLRDRKDYFDTSKYRRNLENSNDKLKHIMSSYFENIWQLLVLQGQPMNIGLYKVVQKPRDKRLLYYAQHLQNIA